LRLNAGGALIKTTMRRMTESVMRRINPKIREYGQINL
jgi:hypothetical protein